ncbi:MAG: hypothetical protein LW701_06275 [Fluviicola sp.]|jgi:hypothetical protein|nr:hypothetical protein [Fluviicola sp.]
MTKSEALLFFPFDESEEEIEEVYESLLFEYKLFFQSKVPIRKVFNSKIQKLKKMHEAFLILGGQIESAIFESDLKLTNGSMLDVFNQYQRLRNSIKVQLLSVENAVELEKIVNQYLLLEGMYRNYWPQIELDSEEQISVSVEPDSMLLLQALKELEGEQICDFSQLQRKSAEKIENNSLNIILMEAKRLSLLRKMDEHE